MAGNHKTQESAPVAAAPIVITAAKQASGFAGPADATVAAAITKLVAAHPRFVAAGAAAPVKYAYGTAGFRAVANTLHSVCVRMGMFASFLSRLTKAAAPDAKDQSATLGVGIMVTASHNEEKDNGLKFISETGEMLTEAWEQVAASVANASDSEVAGLLVALGKQHNVDWSRPATLIVGMDTRPSSATFMELIHAGAAAMNCAVVHYGLCTTPQLHWLVYHANATASPAFAAATHGSDGHVPVATLESYYATLSDAFAKLLGDGRVCDGPLYVDCANGVGHRSVAALTALPAVASRLQLIPFNVGGSSGGVLNKGCGADFVQSGRRAPEGRDAIATASASAASSASSSASKTTAPLRYASLDGDADRVVYHTTACGAGTGDSKAGGGFELLDGDKLIALFAGYLVPLFKATGLEMTVGVVQTAYANGASTRYMTDALGVAVACANTGVKHLHRLAVAYDVGVYFEANGHGTVHFSHDVLARVRTALAGKGKTVPSAEQKVALQRVLWCAQLINQCIGDAVSDLLFAEVILRTQQWTLREWAALYTDLPSRQLKVPVPNPAVVTTTDAERRCTSPAGLQAAIDALVAQNNATKTRRSFVRPSGTEPVVRVYAEAATQAEADALAEAVKAAVQQHCK